MDSTVKLMYFLHWNRKLYTFILFILTIQIQKRLIRMNLERDIMYDGDSKSAP